MYNLEWIQYGTNGMVWHGEINGHRHFQISKMADGSYFANLNSDQGYYGVLHKTKDFEEVQRFCYWLARSMDLI